jgi:hypothetical protein
MWLTVPTRAYLAIVFFFAFPRYYIILGYQDSAYLFPLGSVAKNNFCGNHVNQEFSASNNLFEFR